MKEKMEEIIREVKRESRIKQCVFPDKNNCNGKIKRAHAIQNNRILNKLAVNGDVISMNGVSNIFFQDSKKEGRKIASTFFGFCDYHDTVAFRDIEDIEFQKTDKQVFLFTYRTFAWHYHEKSEELNYVKLLRNKLNTNNEEVSEFIEMMRMGSKDNEERKDIFDDAIINQKYNIINYFIWEIPYELQFAVSGMIELDYDLEGNKINALEDYENLEILKSLYINIFPGKDKSYCICSWFKEDIEYEEFSKQFMKLKFRDKVNYMNNMLPLWTDKIVISPRLWYIWDQKVREAFIAFANMKILITQMNSEHGYKYKYMDTPHNLFQCSSKNKK